MDGFVSGGDSNRSFADLAAYGRQNASALAMVAGHANISCAEALGVSKNDSTSLCRAVSRGSVSEPGTAESIFCCAAVLATRVTVAFGGTPGRVACDTVSGLADG